MLLASLLAACMCLSSTAVLSRLDGGVAVTVSFLRQRDFLRAEAFRGRGKEGPTDPWGNRWHYLHSSEIDGVGSLARAPQLRPYVVGGVRSFAVAYSSGPDGIDQRGWFDDVVPVLGVSRGLLALLLALLRRSVVFAVGMVWLFRSPPAPRHRWAQTVFAAIGTLVYTTSLVHFGVGAFPGLLQEGNWPLLVVPVRVAVCASLIGLSLLVAVACDRRGREQRRGRIEARTAPKVGPDDSPPGYAQAGHDERPLGELPDPG